MQKPLSLYELNEKIRHGLETLFPFPVWIVAEVSEISVRQHCYLELVERDDADKIIAKSRATIWAYTYNIVKPYFETITGYPLSEGLKILIQVEVQYSELYGLSLNVKDIEPAYTIGDLQRRKQLILQRLKDEGILDMNKALEFPQVPKNIAIISSEKAAGYQDFTKQLNNNSFGYKFHTKLFPALMQGEQAQNTIIQALEKIFTYEELFDVVVIIRGGGAVSDLSCFDSYELAANIAQFPLPVLTGIGHDKDNSVVDEISFQALKTPTAVASFLIECFQESENQMFEISSVFSSLIKNTIAENRQFLNHQTEILHFRLPGRLQMNQQYLLNIAKDFNYLIKAKIIQEKNKGKRQGEKFQDAVILYYTAQRDKIRDVTHSLLKNSRYLMASKKENLSHKQKILEMISPDKLLKRGYSITTFKGKIVTDVAQLSKNDEIVTQLSKGKFKATVK